MAEILRVFSGCGLGATGAQGQRLGPPSPAAGLKSRGRGMGVVCSQHEPRQGAGSGHPAHRRRFRVGKR